MKKWQIFLVVFSFLLSLNSISFVRAKSMLIADANNKYDLVSGKIINSKKYNTIYDGKRYWFNSYKNLKIFKKEPSRYIKGPVEKRKNTSNKKAEKKAKEKNSQKKNSFWGW